MRNHSLLAAVVLLGVDLPSASAVQPLVVYIYDQSLKVLLRIEDINNDGESFDAGEVVGFYDNTQPGMGLGNSQGMIALGLDDLLATDNFAPANIMRLTDLNGDHTAFGAGEATVWFSGQLPDGHVLEMPVALIRGPDGAVYMFEQPFSGSSQPDAIYRLEDLNGDGDVNDPGEVTLFAQLSEPGSANVTAYDLEFDAAGYAYYVDNQWPPAVMRIDPVTRVASPYLTNDSVRALTGMDLATAFGGQLAYNAGWGEMIVGGFYGLSDDVLFAFQDADGSGQIDQPNEIRKVWDIYSGTHSPYIDEARDLYGLPDGSILWIEQAYDRCWRLVDLNHDGDYDDANETIVLYDAALAQQHGQLRADRPLTVVAVFKTILGDANCDGAVNFADINPFVLALSSPEAYAAGFPGCNPHNTDVNGDGAVNFGDINPFVALLTGS